MLLIINELMKAVAASSIFISKSFPHNQVQKLSLGSKSLHCSINPVCCNNKRFQNDFKFQIPKSTFVIVITSIVIYLLFLLPFETSFPSLNCGNDYRFMIFAPVSAFQISTTFRLAPATTTITTRSTILYQNCCKRSLHTFTSIPSPSYHRKSTNQVQRSNFFNSSPFALNPRFPTLLHFQSPTITTSAIMNGQEEQLFFNNLASRRITSLFANDSKASNTNDNSNNNKSNNKNDSSSSSSSGEKDFSTKNKSKELKRLASTMDIKVSKVKELLQRQSLKLDPNSEKGKYVNWLLSSSSSSSTSSTSTMKKNDSTAKKLSNINDSNGRKKRKINQSANNNDEQNNKDHIPNNNTNNNKAINQQTATATSNSKSKPNASKQSTTQSATSTNANTRQSSLSSTTSTKNANLHSSTKFQDIELHSLTKKAISDVMHHEYMTDIQSKTYHTAKSGIDVLGRARTGTGKTLAFLIPALERILTTNEYEKGKNIGILVISPTRELATQIGDQADKLLTYHNGLSCQVMYGGTKMNRDINMLNKRLPTILVATPGRLLDHLENTKLFNRQKKFGYDIMRDTPLLVLDEADRLLDMGFKREIQKIMTYLPRQEKRQTLLFSATVPQELKQIMADNMRKDFVEIDCIGGDGSTEFVNGEQHTNTLVEQTHVVLPSMDRYVTSVVEIVMHAMKEKDHKLVVFFPTARLVGFFAEFFKLGLGIDVLEIHSRKTQGYRNQASEKFRKAKSSVLFTSDVSARGVDYPDVSGVIQFGMPESRDQYIHRLGRTGRAGKDGRGILVLAPFESKFIFELKDLDIPVNEEISQLLKQPVDSETMQNLNLVFNRIRSGDAKLTLSAQQAYQAFIGYYRGQLKRTAFRNTEQLVDVANECSRLMGLKEVPSLTKKAAGKMGLERLPNIRIVTELERGRGGKQSRRNQEGRRAKKTSN